MAEQEIADDRQWQWRDGVTVHESGGKGVASLPDWGFLFWVGYALWPVLP
jgi:hypothetical protein